MRESHLSADYRFQLRVLIVENEPKIRQLYSELLSVWGFMPILALGEGEELLSDAKLKARSHHCQIALVDMRLFDNDDPRDRSGLELIQYLRPTASIILSGIEDRKAAVAAIQEYEAYDFVGKDDGPEALKQSIDKVALRLAIYRGPLQLVWANNLSSIKIREQMFPGLDHTLDDQVEYLVARLFPQAYRIVLSLIDDEQHSPNTDSAFASGSTLRRRSRVFQTRVDNRSAASVVKIASRKKVEREVERFYAYVAYDIPSNFRSSLDGSAILWDMGALAYSYLSANVGQPNGPQIFKQHYRLNQDPETIMRPLSHFFGMDSWGNRYQSAAPLQTSLFDGYDIVWEGALSQALREWQKLDQGHLLLPRLTSDLPQLPDPMAWLAAHVNDSYQVIQPREAITHGDLHGDNLFVSAEHAWPIDFERTGPGPILRDFVELIQDVLTRLMLTEQIEATVLFELACAICEPSKPGELMRATERILQNPEAAKAFQVVQRLQKLAYERTNYQDRREYLWGLLLNNLFVANQLPKESLRWEWTLVLAGAICVRLERWKNEKTPWMPSAWPKVSWLPNNARRSLLPTQAPVAGKQPRARATTTKQANFLQGHALIVGVGGDLPATLADAKGVAELLTDARRCAYPPEQVELLRGPQATREAVLAGLERLVTATRRNADATVLIYFSGHGINSPTSYLLTHGWQFEQLERSAVAGHEFTTKIQAIRAKRLLILLDCCHADAMVVPHQKKSPLFQKAAIPTELERLRIGAGRAVLASSRVGEHSLTGTPYSLFTQALLEALAGKGSKIQDGYARVSDIVNYVQHTVSERSRNEQHPVFDFDSMDNFAVAYYAAGETTPMPFDPESSSQSKKLPDG